MELLERRFGLHAAGTSVRTEVTAGLVTFATLSYILFVQPAVLSSPGCGMDPGGVLFATCVASAVACFLMAFRANLPVALAPAMGHNFFFAFAVCAGMGFRWQEALAANLVAGLVFLALSGVGFRERVMYAIPDGLKHAIAVGIGLLIALVGLEWGGIVVDHPVTLVQLGNLSEPVPLLAITGLLVTSALLVRRVRGAILIGILATAGLGAAAGWGFDLERPLVLGPGELALPSPVGTAFELDFKELFSRPLGEWLSVVAIFLVLDLFDTIGTLVGVAEGAGLMRNGRLPRARLALQADAVGTALGATLGTSTVTSYVESAAGTASGGRTGLTAAVCGVCFLLALVFSPLLQSIGAGVDVGDGAAQVMRYPVLAPVLILIGALMMGGAAQIRWSEPLEGIPAFLAIVVMQLSVSITEGIAFGFVSWSFLSLVAGRARDTSPIVHAFSVLFLLRYAFL